MSEEKGRETKKEWPTVAVRLSAESEIVRQHAEKTWRFTHQEMLEHDRARNRAAQSALVRRVPG